MLPVRIGLNNSSPGKVSGGWGGPPVKKTPLPHTEVGAQSAFKQPRRGAKQTTYVACTKAQSDRN